jgi:uncharacterized protein
MTRLEQLRQKRTEILAIADKYGATNLRIFGSVARGDDRPDSDIDILIDQERRWSLFDQIGMMQDLEDLLECKVDLATADALRERIKDRIFKDAIALT